MKRKRKDNKRIAKIGMTVTITALMVLSIFGIIAGQTNQPDKQRYNGRTFQLRNDQWFVKIDGVEYSFYLQPSQVDFYTVDPLVSEKVQNAQAVSITFEDQDDLSYVAVARLSMNNNFNLMNKFVAQGVATEGTSYALPILTCANATPEMPMIYFANSTKESFSEVVLEGNCIIIQPVNSFDSLALGERLIFDTLGITQ